MAYGHQVLASLLSACQRLMPLGQSQASRILWNLKSALLEMTNQNRTDELDFNTISSFAPLVDLGAMRHPALATRLFIS